MGGVLREANKKIGGFGRHSPVGMAERASNKKTGCAQRKILCNIPWSDLQIFQTVSAMIKLRGGY
jgi:hypothetical protein